MAMEIGSMEMGKKSISIWARKKSRELGEISMNLDGKGEAEGWNGNGNLKD